MKRSILLASAALVALAIGTTASGGHVVSGVKSYTGCLATNGGTLSLIKEGSAPQKSCGSGSVEAHFSGGDITKITQGTGVIVSPSPGDNGEVTISLNSQYSLPQGCSSGQVAKWNGSGWACAADNDTTYAADGQTLALSAGNTFSIASAYRVKNTPPCSSGQFATGFDSSGNIQCAAPAANGVEAWNKFVVHADAPQGSSGEVISLDLPAGSFVVTVSGYAQDDVGGNGEVEIFCTTDFGSFGAENESGALQETPFSVTGTVALANAGTTNLTCTSSTGSDHVSSVNMTAIRASVVHSQ